ncbi:PQQ-binding-like beta-propeller repeat protein [Pedobacter antarcticus]|uniref:PQQ-binding-like beta-propeller repeat protein n=1 Tax=Pedobacter antarcticus TaxID=34086 RepID=UPI00292DDA84|nr:PQQ-binding-like beta-propeller repeat protein [Pedobacter antarcticus]
MKNRQLLINAALVIGVLIIMITTGCKKNNNISGDQEPGKETNPVVKLPDSTLFVGTGTMDSTIIYLLNAATGTLVTKYNYPRDAQSTWCVPLVGNGFLYSVEENKINALNINTGAVIWTDSIKSRYSFPPVLHNDTFYGVFTNAPGLNCVVYGLDATKQSNTFLWQYQLSDYYKSINYYNGIIYISGSNLTALDAKTGALKWTLNGPYSLSSLNNGIIISGNTFIDANTGTQVGVVSPSLVVSNNSQTTSIVYATKSIFFTRVTKFMTPLTYSQLNAYDVSTGSLKWNINGGGGYLGSDTLKTVYQIWNNQPILKTTLSLSAGKYGSVKTVNYSELDMDTGQLKWSYTAGFGGQDFTVNNTLYSYGTFTLNLAAGIPASSSIVAADLYTGRQKWTKNNLYVPNGGSVAVCLLAGGRGYSVYMQ